MGPRTIIIYATLGLFIAIAVELIVAALYVGQPEFSRSIEAFDTVLPVLSMGIYWLFNKE